MTREEKIKAIYKEMSNKQKTMGCKYLVYKKNKPDEIMEAIEEGKNFTLYFGDDDYAVSPSEEDYYECYNIKEIIGHPVMMGTIFERYSANKGFINSQFILALVDKWTDYDRSIEEQSDECIDFIYSLIKK